MSTTGYVNYVLDILTSLGNIKSRKMFGGYGIYYGDICFALIVEDVLYFKVDEHNQSIYESYRSSQLCFEGKNGKPIAMSYWEVPADVLESHHKLAPLVEKSVAAALRAKKVKRVKT